MSITEGTSAGKVGGCHNYDPCEGGKSGRPPHHRD